MRSRSVAKRKTTHLSAIILSSSVLAQCPFVVLGAEKQINYTMRDLLSQGHIRMAVFCVCPRYVISDIQVLGCRSRGTFYVHSGLPTGIDVERGFPLRIPRCTCFANRFTTLLLSNRLDGMIRP